MEIRSWLSPRRRQREQAHAYLDGELSPAATARFEAALARDPALAEEVAQLRAIKLAARRLPTIEAPRSFRLTAAMVAAPAAPAPVPVRAPARALRLAQGVAALSLFALSMTFVAGALSGSGGDSDDSAASGESASLAAEDNAGKSAMAPVTASEGAIDSGGGAGGSRSSTTAEPTPAFNPTLPPYSPTSSVSGQAVTATAEPSATTATSPTPRAPATGPGSDVTPTPATPSLPTPVPPSTGGTSNATGPATGAETPFAFNPSGAMYDAGGGVTSGAPIARDDDDDGLGTIGLTRLALGAVAAIAMGTAGVIALRRRRLS